MRKLGIADVRQAVAEIHRQHSGEEAFSAEACLYLLMIQGLRGDIRAVPQWGDEQQSVRGLAPGKNAVSVCGEILTEFPFDDGSASAGAEDPPVYETCSCLGESGSELILNQSAPRLPYNHAGFVVGDCRGLQQPHGRPRPATADEVRQAVADIHRECAAHEGFGAAACMRMLADRGFRGPICIVEQDSDHEAIRVDGLVLSKYPFRQWGFMEDEQVWPTGASSLDGQANSALVCYV